MSDDAFPFLFFGYNMSGYGTQQPSYTSPKLITIGCGPRPYYQMYGCWITEIDYDGCEYRAWIDPEFIVNDGNGICTLQDPSQPNAGVSTGWGLTLFSYNNTCQQGLMYNFGISPLTGDNYFFYENFATGQTFADKYQPYIAAKVWANNSKVTIGVIFWSLHFTPFRKTSHSFYV